MRNISKVNNRDTRTTSLLLTYFTLCSGVPIVNFQQVNTGWEKDLSSSNKVFIRAKRRRSSLQACAKSMQIMFEVVEANWLGDEKAQVF